MSAPTVSHHILLRRDLHASRDEVWAAFTEADALSSWFGPRGFHVPRRSVHVEPVSGGAHRLTMVHNRDRQLRTDVDARYVEVVPGERLLLAQDLHDGHDPMLLGVRLADTDDGTCLELEQGPYPEHMLSPATGGWESTLGKLEAFLAGEDLDAELY